MTSLLGTSVHRKLLAINELSAYKVSRSDTTGDATELCWKCPSLVGETDMETRTHNAQSLRGI